MSLWLCSLPWSETSWASCLQRLQGCVVLRREATDPKDAVRVPVCARVSTHKCVI